MPLLPTLQCGIQGGEKTFFTQFWPCSKSVFKGLQWSLNLLKYRDHLPYVLTLKNAIWFTHCVYVFSIYLRTNSDLCHLQHKLIGFYNRDENCLQRGTDWVCRVCRAIS